MVFKARFEYMPCLSVEMYEYIVPILTCSKSLKTEAPRVHHLIKRRQHRPFLPSCPVSPCRVISHLNIQLLLLLQRTFVYLHLNRSGKKRLRQRKTKQQKHRQEQKKLTQQEVKVIKNHNSSQSHRVEKTPFC